MDRFEYVAGLRALADWLEQTPTAPVPTTDQVLLPLLTNDAVAQFAGVHQLDVETDSDGNTCCRRHFGPLSIHAYGYADFTTFRDRVDERTARQWAARQGLTIQPDHPDQ